MLLFTDKQQEVDITSFRAAQADTSISPVGRGGSIGLSGSAKDALNAGSLLNAANNSADGSAVARTNLVKPGYETVNACAAVTGATAAGIVDENASESMSQISGFRRTLSHANSCDLAPVPRFGVNTDKESELAEVNIQIR